MYTGLALEQELLNDTGMHSLVYRCKNLSHLAITPGRPFLLLLQVVLSEVHGWELFMTPT